ncbi:unnamed protein product [Sphagnum balticum]
MASKNRVVFNVATGGARVKVITLHPKKEWVALITSSNTFSLWHYREKILIKSFNCNTLDETKNLEIREMVFYDRHSLPYPSTPKANRPQIGNEKQHNLRLPIPHIPLRLPL